MFSGERVRTTVLPHWGGHQKDEEQEGDQSHLEKDCGEGEEQGKVEELECS